jgi:hypothetical protein
MRVSAPVRALGESEELNVISYEVFEVVVRVLARLVPKLEKTQDLTDPEP